MKTGYRVYDCMTTKPISVSSDADLEGCAKIMAQNHVGALVIKDNHQSKGLITEQDIVRKVLAKGINPLTKKVKVPSGNLSVLMLSFASVWPESIVAIGICNQCSMSCRPS